MSALKEDFTHFYLSHHQGRRLTYEPSLGTCLVKTVLPNDIRKEIQVSEFQALVLLQFNELSNPPQTFKKLLETTGIEINELKRTLLSLSAGKDQKILLKKPFSLDVLPEHEFCFNEKFKHKLTRIKFNQVQMKETREEQEETEERVFTDRVAQVECCIVRTMKTRKTMEHVQLVSEVYSQLNFPLKAADIKKRIENLIDRDFIERDASNSALYYYKT